MEEILLETTPLVITVEVVPVLDEVDLMLVVIGETDPVFDIALVRVFMLEVVLDADIPVVLTMDEEVNEEEANVEDTPVVL